MSILRWLIPRPARIIRHPLGYAKGRATPRAYRKVRHPIASATGRALGRRRRR